MQFADTMPPEWYNPVQQVDTVTWPSNTDPMRPKQAYDLHQRPASIFLPLVHTEEVIGLAYQLRR